MNNGQKIGHQFWNKKNSVFHSDTLIINTLNLCLYGPVPYIFNPLSFTICSKYKYIFLSNDDLELIVFSWNCPFFLTLSEEPWGQELYNMTHWAVCGLIKIKTCFNCSKTFTCIYLTCFISFTCHYTISKLLGQKSVNFKETNSCNSLLCLSALRLNKHSKSPNGKIGQVL